MNWMVGTPEVKRRAEEIAEHVNGTLGLADEISPTNVRLLLARQPLGRADLEQRFGAKASEIIDEVWAASRLVATAEEMLERIGMVDPDGDVFVVEVATGDQRERYDVSPKGSPPPPPLPPAVAIATCARLFAAKNPDLALDTPVTFTVLSL